ncbi:ATP-binding cassette domain-containing protein [Aristophania vespae]|uniref:ATP-binding cassette domain-containing protein n=1 Tax=Aristophania vespae TaxID=2697033 RepID=A0A6P1NF22_9PROT|nr:ABC transporter ATP-binding protein [Aristophania vespae]QHI95160.1 ATP-binding cassette domain-containing protein [Aristophania vespae]UMM64377.1 Putative multidrug export ATP-binding/permease protein [Aristophania vespae]
MSSIKQKSDVAAVSFVDILIFVMRQWVQHPWFLSRTLGGVALATIADICTPLLAGRLVGDISHPAQEEGVQHVHLLHDALWMVMGLLALGLVGVLGRRSSYIGISHMTLAIMRRILSTAFARVQRFSAEWHSNSFAGSTVRRITRGIWALDSLNDTLLLLIVPEVLVLVGTTSVLIVKSPLMGAVLGLSVVIFAFSSIRLALHYVAPSARLSNQWDTRLGASLADSITCNAVVKAFGAEKREERHLEKISYLWSRRTLRSWIRGTNSANFQASLSLLMRIILIGLVVLFWWQGKAGPGDVAYVLTMMFLIQGYLRDLGQQVSQVQRSVNEMEELVALFNREPDIQDLPNAQTLHVSKGEVRFTNLTFRYPSQQRAIYENLSLTVEPGSHIALVGPSGSGKTTLTRLLQRLYDVQEGAILIDGQNIAHVTQESLRHNIALVPQEPILFHRSLADNISYAKPGAKPQEIIEAARLANALSFIEHLPNGLETLVGERGVKLSGGERQRVAIARAFLADAPIVIFDEATASLDSESEKLVQDAMKRLMKGRTVFVVAHRLSTVRELDRIIVFKKGHIIEDGTHEALMQNPEGAYRKLVNLQSLGAEF